MGARTTDTTVIICTMSRRATTSTPFPYTTLFRSSIAPDDINAVNTPHTFTITLEKQLVDGSFVVLAGKTVTAAVTAGSCTGPTPTSGTTDANGHLTVVVNNTDVGSCTVTARFNGEIDTGDP